MDSKPGASTRGTGKRKRESESSSYVETVESSNSSLSSGCEEDSSFLQRAEAAAIPLSQMLQACQLQLMSHENTGGTIDCCATYSFGKDIKEIKSQQMNDYGRGQLKVIRVGMDGADVQPLPTWMESRISLQVYFEKKVVTNRPHSSGDAKKRGFEVPWRANIQLKNIAVGCGVESIQLSFICPTGQGSPTIVISPDHGGNLYYVNDKIRTIHGQTYSECCQELGIFRQATVYVKMRVPFRLLMREQLGQLREGVPTTLPDVVSFKDHDKVVLKSGRLSLTVSRERLREISQKTENLFAANKSGKITAYEMMYGKETFSTVVYAGVSDFGDFPLDPVETQPSLLYDVMCLALEWDVEPLKWVAQFALLERMCTPGFDVETIPLAVKHIWDSDDSGQELNDIGTFLLAGFIIVQQSMKSNEARGTLPGGVKRGTWLWNRIEDIVKPTADKTQLSEIAVSDPSALLPFLDTICIHVVLQDNRKRTYRVKQSCPIGRIKAVIHGRMGIASGSLRFLWKGKRLEDSETVADYGMQHNDKIEVYTEQVGC